MHSNVTIRGKSTGPLLSFLCCYCLASLSSSHGQDLTLPAAVCTRMRLHAVICATCRYVNEQFGFLRRAMRPLAETRAEDELSDK